MKNKHYNLLVFLLPLIFHTNLSAQQFILADGPVTSVLSDSRSANFIDLNNDNWEDIYISNGLSTGQADLLYLNDGTGNFTQVTNMAVTQAINPSDGASFVDYNNDSYLDGVITSWHNAEDLLYINNGDGQLIYNEDAGIVAGSYAETAAFGDYDNDGWLDLYITNSGGNNKNYLYRNTQDGKFERIQNQILVNDGKLSRGVIWGDFNLDGHLDLFVVNEGNGSNDLFLGQGEGNYSKVTEGSLVTSQRSTMTASWGDIDNDGDFDAFIGNAGFFVTQQNQLFINEGNEFVEVTEGDLVQTDNCTFGSSFGDYDNDGDLDLLIANGFCSTNLSNALYANQGDGTFADSSHLLSSNPAVCSFGVAWGDINNDGFLDLLSANCRNNSAGAQQNNTLLVNQGNENHWLKVKLEGLQSNRNGVGAIIRIKATINGESIWQMREVRSQTGYAGQNSLIAHFGLGSSTIVDSLIVDWPSGVQQVMLALPVDQRIDIMEDLVDAIRPGPNNAFDFSVFPNPLAKQTNEITIQLPTDLQSDSVQVQLLNQRGQLIGSQEYDAQNYNHSLTFPINIGSNADQHLAAGIYLLLVKTEKGSATKKLVIH